MQLYLDSYQSFFKGLSLVALFLAPSSIVLSAVDNQPLRIIEAIDEPTLINEDLSFERNAFVLESSAPNSKKLELKPWEAGHWPLDSGILGRRYADSSFQKLAGWKAKHQYVLRHPTSDYARISSSKKRSLFLDQLSPAEKYDLIFGDGEQSLTNAQWQEGESRALDGTLAGWMGICEGSAAASVIYPQPKRAVGVPISTGETVYFHILDIKALASLLWSAYNVAVPVSGTRCRSDSPKKDRNDVVIDSGCFNSNPGSWHIVLLNYLGIKGQTFFINRTLNQQVWNVPILGYSLRYFDLVTKRYSDNIKEVTTPIDRLSGEKYFYYRSPNTASVVGVDMIVTMSKGGTEARDQPQSTSVSEVNYIYDLELDINGKILGGEWHSDIHPDFIWAINDPFKATSSGDLAMLNKKWEGEKIPPEWLAIAKSSSLRNQPLELIVRRLIELSTQ